MLFSPTSTRLLSLIPLPSQLFSVTAAINEVPSVPTPAPAEISPVALSSTEISKTFKSGELPSKIFLSTFPKICLALSLLIDLFTSNALNGSPSSTIISLLITESLVTLFPTIFILSIINLSPSNICIFTSTLFSSNVSMAL